MASGTGSTLIKIHAAGCPDPSGFAASARIEMFAPTLAEIASGSGTIRKNCATSATSLNLNYGNFTMDAEALLTSNIPPDDCETTVST
jgi:hypothetical protein